MPKLDRSQSDFYFVPQEIQTDTATPLSMEIFGRIDSSLGKLITRVTKTPKPTKQHVTWAVELVRIFFHSLLWPWEPLSWRSLWNCSVGGHDFPPIWVHDFSLPIASSTQPKGSTMPSYYYAYKNTESRLNWNSFNPWRCFYMDVVYTKTNVKTETEAKTSTKRFKDPMYALFLKISGFRDNKNWHLNGRVGHGHDGHGRSGEIKCLKVQKSQILVFEVALLMYLSLSLSLSLCLSSSLSFCWSGHIFSSAWSNVSKVKSIKDCSLKVFS